MSLDSFVSECVCTEHSVPHSDVFPVEACSPPQTRLCPCAGSQKPRSGLSCSPGPFGSRRCVRCLCTELVRLKWEFGLYPVIPIQTHACRINYNTSENLNIMVRFHFSPSFSEAISLLWRPDWSLWIGPRFHTFKRTGFCCNYMLISRSPGFGTREKAVVFSVGWFYSSLPECVCMNAAALETLDALLRLKWHEILIDGIEVSYVRDWAVDQQQNTLQVPFTW